MQSRPPNHHSPAKKPGNIDFRRQVSQNITNTLKNPDNSQIRCCFRSNSCTHRRVVDIVIGTSCFPTYHFQSKKISSCFLLFVAKNAHSNFSPNFTLSCVLCVRTTRTLAGLREQTLHVWSKAEIVFDQAYNVTATGHKKRARWFAVAHTSASAEWLRVNILQSGANVTTQLIGLVRLCVRCPKRMGVEKPLRVSRFSNCTAALL